MSLPKICKQVVLLKSQVAQQGGLEKYASRIAHGFIDRGMNVSILTTDNSKNSPEVDVHSIKTCRWPAFWRMEQFDRFVQQYLKDHPTDLVFGMDRNRYQTHYRAGNGVHAAFLKSRRYTDGVFKQISFRFNPLHRKILELEKAAFENPTLEKLFANSQMVRREILEYYRTDPSKIQVIHNGVEWHEMENDFSQWSQIKNRLAREKGLDPSQFHFLFIGNGYLRKGLKQLMQALSHLKTTDFHLSVIGKDSSLKDYQRLAYSLHLENHISFFGPQKEIRPFYQIADALVIPSFYDPFANVTVEALAMGLYVVSSKSNGGHEVLSHENGEVISNLLDIDSVADSVSHAMDHPKTNTSANQIRASVKHLDFSNQMQQLIDACLTRENYGS